MAGLYDDKGSKTPRNEPSVVLTPDELKEADLKDVHLRHLSGVTADTASTLSATTDDHTLPIQASDELTRTFSTKLEIVRVPRNQRRGLFARFAILDEVTEPKDYPNGRKWLITFIVAEAAMAAPIGSSIIFPSLDQISQELHATPTITNLNVALYMLSMAIFPLWWSSFSETFGRRTVYLLSFALYVVASAICAVSTDIAMLVVFRMIAGGAAASVQAVGAGSIADIWAPFERGRAMGIFYLGPLCGPLLAPILGGALAQRLGWRSTQWAQVIFGALTWIFVFFALPETLKQRKNLEAEAEQELASRPPLSRHSTRERVQQTSRKWSKIIHMLLVEPLLVVKYLRFMPIILTVYYCAVTFGTLYILNISIQYTFERQPYKFSTIDIGLLYISNSLGYFTASIFGGRWMDKIMAREARRAKRTDSNGRLILLPEDRMRENVVLAAILYPGALMWYGWTAQKGVYWLVPILANFFYGVGSMLVFATVTTMLTEFLHHKSSAGIALNNLCRNIFSCVGAIVAAPIIDAIGNGWLFTILGLWSLASAIVIWLMKRYGPKWRESMDQRLKSEMTR